MHALLAMYCVHFSCAQEKSITGSVLDQDGLPLPGVSVVIVGTTTGTQTDFDGNYAMTASVGDVLRFSYLGLRTTSRTVGASPRIDVQMEEDAEALEEVVVIGYGTKKRDELASAVSTVKAEDISSFVATTSIDNILQGQAAGVQITAGNGRPGNTAFVRIRGTATFTQDSDPLYVIDGVPLDPADVNLINPNDIESVSILKDAATASRYGSRAANGVILITTKQGKKGDAKITLTQTVGFTQRIQDNFDIFDIEGKLEYERQLAELGVAPALNLPGATASPEERQFLIDNAVNHEEELLRKGFITTTNLSVSGGSDRLTYFFSAGYSEDTGIVQRAQPFRRYTARLNTTYQAKDWLTFGVNANFARSSEQRLREGRNNVQNPFRAIYEYNPYNTIFVIDENGDNVLDEQGDPIFSQSFPLAFNIAEAIINNLDLRTNLQSIATGYADIKFSDCFSNKFQVGVSNNRFNRQSIIRPFSRLDAFIRTPGAPGQSTRQGDNDFEYNISNVFAFNKSFGKSKVNASMLFEYNENVLDRFTLTGEGFPTDQLDVLTITSLPTTASTRRVKNTLFSQGLFADYNYDDKYIVSGSVRRDGSSRFGPNNQFGVFGSGALAWNIHNEKFMEGGFFNTLKIRASYGTSGNQNFGGTIINNFNSFTFLELLDFGSGNGRSNVSPAGAGNPDIKWESQEVLDVGLEYAFWNNRVRGVIDYFQRTSNDLLSPFNLSGTVGDENNQVTANIGEIRNNGLELELSVDAIQTQNVRWTLGGNIVFIDNEVTELVNGVDQFRGSGDLQRLALSEGEEANTFNLVRYAGVNSQTGAPQYLDIDGNITETFRGSDAVILSGKSTIADIEGGFFSNFSYKGFDLGTNFVFRYGNWIYNAAAQALLQDGNGVNQQQRTDALNFWRSPGDTDVLPSPLFRNDANQASDRFLQKGDFVRLRNLTLGYSLPNKFTDKLPIEGLRMFLQGQNLWTFRPHFDGDPEIGDGSTEQGGFQTPGSQALFNYPNVQTYSFGIEINF
ncbi:MAG: TonB-dependent receptor [Bacteroidota bacterium]